MLKLLNSTRRFSTYFNSDKVFRYCNVPKTVNIIGVPFADGQPLSGVNLGPEVLRTYNLHQYIKNEGWNVIDSGDIPVVRGEKTENAPIDFDGKYGKLKLTKNVSKVNYDTYRKVYEEAKKGDFMLTLGGDHSIAIGSVAGLLKARPNLNVIWVDAHADINTPYTSQSGNVHGMVTSFLLKHKDSIVVPGYEWLSEVPVLDPRRLVYIGLRDVDDGEKRLIREYGIKVFTMHDIDRYGIANVMELALRHLRVFGDNPIHLSFDIDAVDPIFAPATGTRVGGGLTYREAYFLCEAVSETGLLSSMDLVEINPSLSSTTLDKETTIKMGNGLVASALGNTIL